MAHGGDDAGEQPDLWTSDAERQPPLTAPIGAMPLATGSDADAVGGIEQHLLELTRQVATPHQARRGGQGAFVDAGADHAGGASCGIRLGWFGPAPGAVLRAGEDRGGPAGGGHEGEGHRE